MIRRYRRLWPVAVLLLAAAGVFWAYRQAARARDLADPVRARREGRPIPVRTAQVSEADVEHVIGGTAVTVPSDTATLRPGPSRSKQSDPTAEAVVRAVHAQEGEFVKRGQVVAELDDTLAGQIVKLREAGLAAATADADRVRLAVDAGKKARLMELASAEAEVKFRTEDLESRKLLHDTIARLGAGRAVSDRELFDAKSRLAEAGFRLTEAERRLQRAKDAVANGPAADQAELTRAASLVDTARTDLEAARGCLEAYKVRSPFDGFLTKVDAAPGQSVGSGPLAQVVRLDPLHVRMDFPLDRLAEVAVGQKAEVVLDGFPQQPFEGTVARIFPQATADLRVLPVVIELANPGGRLKAGMTGFARVRTVRRTTSVPSLAVMRRGGMAVAFRVEDGRARLREVRLGSVTQPEMLEVRAGLAAGDEVVVFHNFYGDVTNLTANECYLQDNDRVDADWRKWTRRE